MYPSSPSCPRSHDDPISVFPETSTNLWSLIYGVFLHFPYCVAPGLVNCQLPADIPGRITDRRGGAGPVEVGNARFRLFSGDPNSSPRDQHQLGPRT